MKLIFSILLVSVLFFSSCVTDDIDPDTGKEGNDVEAQNDSDETVDVPDEKEETPQNDEEQGQPDEDVIAQPDEDDVVDTPDEEDVTSEFCTDYATVFPLQPGDCVPDFTLFAQDGVTTVTLSDHRGKYVLFSSFPMANTSVCTGQMQKLDEMYNDFIAENIMPFGFNNESPDKKEGWCETMGIVDLLILADHNPKDAVSIMFGINGFTTARANTVIGPDGRFIMKKACANSTCIPAILEDIKNLK
jgi:peroxiredoxin